MIDGTQAEYVRTPYADNSLVPLPDNVNEEVALLLSDALPTAQLYSPAAIIVCDMDENRLKLAKELGATHTISPASGDVSKQVFAIVGEDGVDCAIEAVGIPATWNMCQDIVKPGGHIAVVGVHVQSVDFKLEKLWIKNLAITTGLVNANTTEMLMKAISSSSVDYTKMLTHHFKFSELEKAYDVFKHAAENQAMKVVLEAD